jgi:aryl-alcohol dehydrogenase-like predicted oxidoreductase
MTKIRMPTNDSSDVNSCGLSRNNIIDSVEECLNRLQTDHIDLLQINGWDTSVSTFDLVKDLDDLVRSGKVRYIGCCDLKAWQLQKLIDYSKYFLFFIVILVWFNFIFC